MVESMSASEKAAVPLLDEIRADDDVVAKAEGYRNYGGLVKSRFDELSIGQTLWVFRRVVLVALAVYTGNTCEGFELGVGGSIVANEGFIKQFGAEGGTGVRALDPFWLSTWSACLNFGQIITFTHVSWFADTFGPKRSFYLSWVWLVLGCIFLNSAKTPLAWAVAKLCQGAGVGVLQVTCQVYVMEICPNKIRGGLVTFSAVWGHIGGIICSVIMQQLNQLYPNDYLFAVRILWVPIGLTIFFWSFVPESPWFYARHGDKDKAMQSMIKLYGGVEGYDFEEEYGIIVRTIKHERKKLHDQQPSYAHVFDGVNLQRTLTVMLLGVASQLAGLSIIGTYSTYFFSLAGLEDPFFGTVILACSNLVAVIAWAVAADRFGRRIIINSCHTFVCAILFLVGSLYWTGATTGNTAAGTLLLIICCFWTCAFQIIGMSYFLYSAELPSALLRVKTGPAAFFANSIMGIATCYATPPMLLALSIKSGFVFGALSVPICILMWLYIPETKGRSAAEIDELYERKIPAWRWDKTYTAAEEQMHIVCNRTSRSA
ncbi:general substrate transporter [Xylariales sp. PMI_506]|nr:general substrate transporter [Xylariales sp. PMI_506]